MSSTHAQAAHAWAHAVSMRGRDATYPDHAASYDALISAAQESVAKAGRARKYGDWHLRDARQSLEQANAYNVDFALGHPLVTLESLGVAVAALQERLAAAAAVAAERERQRRIERAEREREAREAWLAGAGSYWHGTDANGCALLRLLPGDPATLQTSQGARVPLRDAIRAFRFAKLCRERGNAWQRNGQQVPVGDFQLDKIAADGTLRAGCHLIAWSEIERLARLVGVLDEPASDEAIQPSKREVYAADRDPRADPRAAEIMSRLRHAATL